MRIVEDFKENLRQQDSFYIAGKSIRTRLVFCSKKQRRLHSETLSFMIRYRILHLRGSAVLAEGTERSGRLPVQVIGRRFLFKRQRRSVMNELIALAGITGSGTSCMKY